MKRIIPFLLVWCLLIGCSGGGRKMSEQSRKYAEKALAIADQYLDFDISAEKAHDMLEDLESSAAAIPTATDKEIEQGDRAVRVAVMSLSWDLVKSFTDKSAAQEILGDRNRIASLIGKSER